MNEKLNLIEEDLNLIRNLLNEERSALKDFKELIQPIVGFFGVKKSKSVNFAPISHISNSKKVTVTFGSNEIVDAIEHISPHEFDGLPKYLKGRLTVAKVNNLVDDFNRFILEKYTLLARANPAKLSLEQRQRFMEWKTAETDETVGKFFITESDLKTKSATGVNFGFKFDQVTRNILTILRQVGRIKEHRSSGGIIRYIININRH